jgi:RNA polymerase sigma-70 factor (ECF subfamily)
MRVALSEIDRSLLQRCLDRKPRAWEDFVDRFLGLAVHVVNHSAQARSIRLTLQDTEDLAAEVFLAVVDNDFALLRRFRGNSSLATYLTVVARRIVVRELLKRKSTAGLSDVAERNSGDGDSRLAPHEQRISNREEVERLLRHLQGSEAQVIRMYHLEGKSYQEISSSVGMPENSIGPTLSRARAKLRQVSIEAKPG